MKLPTLNILETFGLTILISLLAPREFSLNNKEKKPEVIDSNEINKKLENLFQDITSQFKA